MTPNFLVDFDRDTLLLMAITLVTGYVIKVVIEIVKNKTVGKLSTDMMHNIEVLISITVGVLSALLFKQDILFGVFIGIVSPLVATGIYEKFTKQSQKQLTIDDVGKTVASQEEVETITKVVNQPSSSKGENNE